MSGAMPRLRARRAPSARSGSDGGDQGSAHSTCKRKRNPQQGTKSHTVNTNGVNQNLDIEASIDDIFATLKASKRQKAMKSDFKVISAKEHERLNRGTILPRDKGDNDNAWRAGTRSTYPDEPKVHRYTEDGLAVYKYYHLGIHQEDGGTPYCPFDCDCCR